MRSTALRASIGAASLAGLACAAGPGAPGPRNDNLREATFGEPSELTASGAYRARVALPFELEQVEGEPDEIQVPLEGSLPITCLVWNDEAELGATVARTVSRLFEGIEREFGAVSDKRIIGIQGGAVGGTPHHGIEWSFRVGERVGIVKVAAANKAGRGIACNHFDAGFRATFQRVFLGLVESFEVLEPPPAPYYSEVVVVRVGGLPIGVEWTQLSADQDGDTRVHSTSSMLLPTDLDSVTASFSTTIEWATPDGNLINAYAFETDVDTAHTDLALRWSRERGWHVIGRFHGKELEAELTHDGPIASGLAELRALRHRLAPRGGETAIRMARWTSDADPTAVLGEELETLPGDAQRVRMSLGPIQMQGVRDADGLLDSGAFQMGRLEMTMESVFRQGDLPSGGAAPPVEPARGE